MFFAIFDIITIGLPFCVFKIIAGIHFQQYWLILLGLADLIINLVNFVLILIKKDKIFDTCLLSFLVHKIKHPSEDIKSKWQDLGESLDVLLSFSIVAYVIGLGHITNLVANHVMLWNIAVVLNVLGAGYGRLMNSVKRIKENQL